MTDYTLFELSEENQALKNTVVNLLRTQDLNKERIYRLVPRANADVNDYWMCDDGRHGWGYIHDDDRLMFPTTGKGDDQNLVLWNVAIEQGREKLEAIKAEHGVDAIAGLASPHLTNEEQFLFGKLFTDGIGGGTVALQDATSSEGDVVFKSGFTIRADKASRSGRRRSRTRTSSR